MHLRHVHKVDAPTAEVIDALRKGGLHVARARRDQGCVAARCVPREPHGFDVETESYRRKPTGGLDRSQTERAVQRFRWDKDGRTLRWTWSGPGDDRVQLSGRLCVLGEEGGSRVESEVDITVDIPLVHRMIEGLVAREMSASEATFVEDLLRFVRS